MPELNQRHHHHQEQPLKPPPRRPLRCSDMSSTGAATPEVSASEEKKEDQPVKPAGPVFEREKHLRFLLGMSRVLPAAAAGQDSNRLTLAYFTLSALDLLGELDKIDRKAAIDWVYSNQVVPDVEDPESNWKDCGFRGSK